MSKTIEGVPESITRADYTRLIESVGFDPMALISLEFVADGIAAVVAADDGEGNAIHSPTEDDEFAIAVHKVFIPVSDKATS